LFSVIFPAFFDEGAVEMGGMRERLLSSEDPEVANLRGFDISSLGAGREIGVGTRGWRCSTAKSEGVGRTIVVFVPITLDGSPDRTLRD
jgi:hypothetical protein